MRPGHPGWTSGHTPQKRPETRIGVSGFNIGSRPQPLSQSNGAAAIACTQGKPKNVV